MAVQAETTWVLPVNKGVGAQETDSAQEVLCSPSGCSMFVGFMLPALTSAALVFSWEKIERQPSDLKENAAMTRLSHLSLGIMALVLVLALVAPALASDEAAGKIKSIDTAKNQFVLHDANGKDWTFQMDKDSKVMLDGKASQLSSLRENDELTITYEKKLTELRVIEVRCTRK
jgi:hypothetical protein